MRQEQVLDAVAFHSEATSKHPFASEREIEPFQRASNNFYFVKCQEKIVKKEANFVIVSFTAFN
jgi:hypothetical protein